jgi:predicted nucleic acid-binding protein
MIFQEDRAEEAWELVTGYRLQEPVFVPYELTRIARKKIREYPERRDEFTQLLHSGLKMNMTFPKIDHPEVLRLALETGLTTYDASYLYVSQATRAPLVTFDKKLQLAATGVNE